MTGSVVDKGGVNATAKVRIWVAGKGERVTRSVIDIPGMLFMMITVCFRYDERQKIHCPLHV